MSKVGIFFEICHILHIFAVWVKQSDVMLDKIRQQFIRLISAYERERSERIRLEEENGRLSSQCEAYGKQIAELEKKIDSLNLTAAFVGTQADNSESKRKIESLIREIDRCIRLMEG